MYNKPSKLDMFIRVCFCVFMCLLMILPTLYVTVLYKHTPSQTIDYILKDVSFLPMNIERNKNVTNGQNIIENTVSQVTEPSLVVPETTVTQIQTEPSTTEQATQITTEPTTVKDNMVTVPDFSEYTYSQIKSNKKFNKNFEIIYEFEFSDTVEENHVIGQRAAIGERVEKGSKINLVISRGVEKILLRDVVGMDYDTARELLIFAGFGVREKVIPNDGTQTPHQVFSMSLEPGKKYDRNTQIELTIWGE